MYHPHKLNLPTTLVFCRKVDLKVIIVIMDIKKTTSFIKLGNAVKFTLGKRYFEYNYCKKQGNEEVFFFNDEHKKHIFTVNYLREAVCNYIYSPYNQKFSAYLYIL